MATLYVVSTPIGNLEDITRRAERILRDVDRVLAEDTRRTGVLMRHLGLSTPLVSLHAHNEQGRAASVVRWLGEGEDVALVSDAGTPLVSDPGERLVDAVLEAGHAVVSVPGASSVLAALVASGLPTDRFAFLGFVPRKGADRTRTLERIADSAETTVLFESPERVGTLLEELVSVCGGERRVAVARELTKLHEEVRRGTLGDVGAYYGEADVRGEITVVVAPAGERAESDEVDEAAARALAKALLDEGTSPSRAAREIARRLGIPRNAAYGIVQDLSDDA